MLEHKKKVFLPTESHDFDHDADSDSSDSSCTSDGSRSAEKSENKLRPLAAKMVNVFKEIGLLFLAIFFTYAALTNEPPKVSKSPTAFPFFPKNSVVVDFYQGHLTQAYEYARTSDVSFIMFYAPWDRKSQEMRGEFEIAARYMQNLVKFAAVNCWHPGGECRSLYSKVYNWPVLIAYPAHGRGIVFNGPPFAPHFIRFLKSIMQPVFRIAQNEDINYYLAQYDALIVAEVDAHPGSFFYNVVYNTAMLLLESDPFQEVGFAVSPEPYYKENGDVYPFLALHTWNATYEYPSDGEWKSSAILSWILKKIKSSHHTSSWVYPIGSKSQQLSSFVQPGPCLILFTPKSPLAESIDYYSLIREASIEYFSGETLAMDPEVIHMHRISSYYNQQHLRSTCPPLKEKTQKISTVVTYSTNNCWTNNSCFTTELKSCLEKTCSFPDILRQKTIEQCSRNPKDYLEDEKRDENVLEKSKKRPKKIKTSKNNNFETSMLDSENDSHSQKNLLRVLKENNCRTFQLSEYYFPQVFSENLGKIAYENLTKIFGLADNQNTSLSFIAMDSLKFHHFAERLGIDVLNKKNKTAVVIVNEKYETHHVLEQTLTDLTLKEFIYNFTHKMLPRAVQSSSIKFKNTHVYTVEKRKNNFYVNELNSFNFMKTIMEIDKAVIVLYYSKQCAFCSGLSYVFLTVAKTLSAIDSIKFARIDGELNSLPWEYTMEKYPTVLFFPARRKSESRSYPQNIPITVPNLLSFVITNLEASQRLFAMWSLCENAKFVEDKESCIISLRAETLSLTDIFLKKWRKSLNSRRKSLVLYKLQQLRNLHILLAHTPKNKTEIERFMRKLFRAPSYTATNLKSSQKVTKMEL